MEGKEIIRLAQAVDTLAYTVIIGFMIIGSALSNDMIRFFLWILVIIFFAGMFGQSSSHKKERRHYGIFVEEDNDE